MKKLLMAMLLAMTMTGCQCSTPAGDCIGIADDPVPGVTYKASTRNIILGIVFVETIAVPAYVVLADLKCPVYPQPTAP